MRKFNVKLSDDMYRRGREVSEWMHFPIADVIREAVSIYRLLAVEYRQGGRPLVQRVGGEVVEMRFPILECPPQHEMDGETIAEGARLGP